MPQEPVIDYTTTRHFSGINAWKQPGDLGQGELVAADNLLVVGSNLQSRPGRQGVLATPEAAPVYALGAFRKASGVTACLYTSGGKVKFVNKSADGVYDSAPTEILLGGASLAINSATAVGCRLGKYFYFADGTPGGLLYRTDTTGATATISQNPPTSAITAALTSTLIDPLTSGSWTPDTLTGAGQANRLPNSSFASLTGAHIPAGYTGFGATPDAGLGPFAANLPSGTWLKLDDPYEGIFLTNALVNDPVAADASRYAKQFYGAFDFFQGDTLGQMTVVMTVSGYSDSAGTALVGQITKTFTAPFAAGGTAITVDGVFSFAAFSAEILSYRVQWAAGGGNTKAVNAPYVTNVVLFPFASALTATVSGMQVEVKEPQALTYTGGTQSAANLGTVGYGVGAGGQHLTRDFGSGNPQDWGSYSNVVLGLTKAYGITNLTLMLAFRQDGSATRYYTNAFAVSADGTAATCDISTVLESVRSAFRYVEIILGGDFLVPATNGSDLFLFGPLTGAGNLSIGYADYSWVFTEVNGNSDAALADVIESNPSPQSGSVTPTVLKAEGSLALPAGNVNAATTCKAVYRYGGVFVDNPAVGRLIAVVPIGADIALGTDPRNPYYSWNHATGLLVDNTPDSFILQPGVFPNTGTPLILGRDLPPTGVQALCAYHGRLICAAGSTVYVSWLVTPGNPSALYFTNAQLPNDPNQAIKGNTFTAGGSYDNDPVQALVPVNTAVVIEKMTSKLLLQGFDGATLNVQDYLKGTGVGCVAFRAACLVQNQEVALGASGLHGFNVAEVTPLSLAIEPLLRPKGWDGNPVIPPAVFSLCCCAEHDRRLYLSAPGAPTDTQNTVTYVYDTRTGGWTRWTFGATTIVSLSSATDGNDCFLGGYDGMLYVLGGNSDQASAAGPAIPIPISVTTRGFGQESDDTFWAQDQMDFLDALVTAPAGTALTFTVGNDAGLSAALPAYTWAGGQKAIRLNSETGLRGFYLTLSLACSVTGVFKLTALRAEITEGARRS